MLSLPEEERQRQFEQLCVTEIYKKKNKKKKKKKKKKNQNRIIL